VPAVLVDAGPLIALLDRRDVHHRKCVKVFEGMQSPLLTAWPVVAEAMHLLATVSGGVDALWGMLEDPGVVRLLPLEPADYSAMRLSMHKYRDQRMDLGDAALVRLAAREHLTTIFTLDRDFQVYRIGGTGRFTIVP